MLFIVPSKDFGKAKSGVGTFATSAQNFGYDVITDGDISDVSRSQYFSYATKPVIDHGKVQAIQLNLLAALDTKPYRAIVCSNLEAVEACIGLSLPNLMPVYYRMHNSFGVHNLKGLGSEKAQRIIQSATHSNIKLLVHSPHAKDLILKHYGLEAYIFPNLIKLACPTHPRRNYLLIIARYDKVKRPEVCAQIADASGLDVVVMCGSPQQAKKWTTLLKSYNIKSHVVFNVSGEEKDSIIQGAGAALICSEIESFGQAVVETVMYCPTMIVTKDIDWDKNFAHLPIYEHLLIHSDHAIPKSGLPDFYKKLGNILSASTTKRYKVRSSKFLRKELENITTSQWKEFPESIHEYKDYKLGRSELIQDFNANGFIDWKNYPVLQRTLKSLHEIFANFDYKIKGTIVKLAKGKK